MERTVVCERDLKTRPGTYLRRVRKKRTLLVTDRGDPRISPPAWQVRLGGAEMLLFFGGFDRREIMDDTSRDAGRLAFLYPVSDIDGLKQKLGRVDLLSASGPTQ
jgi:hypothetical protein